MVKRICIIGGGASGITAAKACEEEQLDYVIYEMHHSLGGLWRYKTEVSELASVAASTVINSSKEMSAFSDFPPEAHYPNYMHNSRMLDYIEQYATSVGCLPKMKFQHRVIGVKKSASFELDGRWDVEVEDLAKAGGQRSIDTFDGVMVATGHHMTPTMASFPGQARFKGKIMHSHSYKTPNEFAGKRVVVVGIGNSGLDAAVELSMINEKVFVSTRRGAWVLHRVGPRGLPFDTCWLTRHQNLLFQIMPHKLNCMLGERHMNSYFDHSIYNIKPKHRIYEQHVCVNDALPNRILSGTIELKHNIEMITETGVFFQGDKEETACDVILMCTGYEINFPFLDKSLIPVKDNKVDLYKYVFSPNLHPHQAAHTLGFIGLVQPIGALFPICELQSRWFALLMNGKRQLPPAAKMSHDIAKKRKLLEARYYSGARNTIQVDWIPYMDELAKLVGCEPNLSKFFFKDFQLWLKLVFEPCYPYQYRLEGPHSWAKARETILTAKQRIKAPLRTRP